MPAPKLLQARDLASDAMRRRYGIGRTYPGGI